ncbi:hypothetical protein GCM10009647_074760 [Streptomyces sanglieri]|uniref:Uncharacterized protein n=2 Tax=Streptomyces TaxID=1883 RepID=A0ABW2WN55_9ACTN
MSESHWDEPQASTRETGCTDAEMEEINALLDASFTTGREFRAGMFAVGDWLNKKFGPLGRQGNRVGADSLLEALAAAVGRSPQTLRKWRMTACRWRPEQRDKVLSSPVYAPFTVMHHVALNDGKPGEFDQERFDAKVEILLQVMNCAQDQQLWEVTETDYLKAVRKAIPPSRQAGAQAANRALAATAHHFEARRPETRAAVLDLVRADEDATRAIAASYLMQRPGLARAVLREDPELAESAAQEAAGRASDESSGTVEDTFNELVQVLGGGQPSDDLLLAEWREDFARVLGRFRSMVTTWYPAETVTAKADDNLLALVAHLQGDVDQWARAITESRKPGLRLVESTTA